MIGQLDLGFNAYMIPLSLEVKKASRAALFKKMAGRYKLVKTVKHFGQWHEDMHLYLRSDLVSSP